MLQCFQRSDFERKTVVLMEQEFVEVEQLTALSLPSHPDALAGVEDAMAMQEEEGSAVLAAVFCVQLVDALRG